MTTSASNRFTSVQPAAFQPDLSTQPATQTPHTDRRRSHRRSQRRETGSGSYDPAVSSRIVAQSTAVARVLANAQGPALAADPASSASLAGVGSSDVRNERYADEAELNSLLDRYDADGTHAKADARNAELGAQLEKAAMTGYPDDARAFEQHVQTDLGMCADLPLDARADYEATLKELWTGFEAATDAWHRSRFADSERALHNVIAGELDDVTANPEARLQAVFNAPFGSDMLDAQGQQQLLALADARKEFRQARTPQQRDAAFSRASEIKQQLQTDIATATLAQIDEQAQIWTDARTDVLNALQSASALTGPGATAGARLADFGNHVFADAHHARAFTELRMREPERFRQLTQWENDLAEQDRNAARLLPEVSLAAPRNFSDIRFALPALGSQYEDTLRALYMDALHSIVAADKRISMASEPKSSPIRADYIKTHRSAT